MGLFRKKETHVKQLDYDKSEEKPIIRASICNGERVAGFKNIRTGKFREQFFIRDDAEIEMFARMCGVEKVDKEY